MRVAISLFLFAFYRAECRIVFTHSAILDEFDFKGQSTVIIDGLCRSTCHIYASITDDSRKLAQNLLIQTSKGFTTIAAVADLRDPTANQKLFLEVNNTASLSIVNGNAGNAAGPLVLYVVSRAAENFGVAEVYEASGLERSPKWVQVITVMSAAPFTLMEANYTAVAGPIGLSAILSGFDTRSEGCKTVYSLNRDPFPGFTLTVNGPIVTLFYEPTQNHYPIGELSATIGMGESFPMEPKGFVNSPGYHGCPEQPLFRSSLYDFTTPIVRSFHSLSGQEVSVQMVVDSDEKHPVSVLNTDTHKGMAFYDTNGEYAVGTLLGDQNFEVTWPPVPDKFFLVIYDSTVRFIID